jgi:hypothetical protein
MLYALNVYVRKKNEKRIYLITIEKIIMVE